MMLNTYPMTGALTKASWNTLGRVMKMSEGPTSSGERLIPALKTAGKMMKPARIAMAVSMLHTLKVVFSRLVSLSNTKHTYRGSPVPDSARRKPAP